MIIDQMKSLKKNEKIVLNSTILEQRLTGILFASISKNGTITITYTNGQSLKKRPPLSFFEQESLSYFQINAI